MSLFLHLVRQRTDHVVSVFVGFITFGFLAGPALINPSFTTWLRWGDAAQHYYGWEFFRRSPLLQFPLGNSPQFGVGYSSSVVYTDSIPLLAIPLKYLTSWWDGDFQYFGAWLLGCFILQHFVACRILRRLGMSARDARVGALFFVVAPVFLHRQTILGYGHMALAGHFLLLIGILLVLDNSAFQRRWVVLLVVSLLVQFYLFVMIFVLWLSSIIVQTPRRATSLTKIGLRVATTCSLLVGVGWIVGYFSSGSSVEEGFGIFRADLATFIDPQTISATSWSRVLPDQPVVPKNVNGSFEGFAFLGLGILLALFVGLIGWAASRSRREPKRNLPQGSLRLVLPPALACFVFALSNRITFRVERVVLPLPEPFETLGNTLRASGRFVWPLAYVVMSYAIVLAARVVSKRRLGVILLASLAIVQVIDSREALVEHRERFTEFSYPKSVFRSLEWKELAESKRVLIADPPPYKGDVWQDFSEFALQNGLATNSGYLSRVDYVKLYESEVAVRNSLLSNRLQRDALYVVTRASGAYATIRSQLGGFDGELAPGVRAKFLDGMIAVTSDIP
jgi:hypothetical protein